MLYVVKDMLELTALSLQTLLSPGDATQTTKSSTSFTKSLLTIVIVQLELQQLKAAQIKESAQPHVTWVYIRFYL